eukprot:gene1353-22714_t
MYHRVFAAGFLAFSVITGADAGCHPGKPTCYVDYGGPNGAHTEQTRVLGPLMFSFRDLTLEMCAQACKNHNMPFAGVEDGSQCFCGKTINPIAKLKPTGCKTPVQGNKKEMGGGQFEVNVYQYTCSGRPTPVPHPPAPPAPPCKVFNEYGCAELYNPCLNSSEPAYKYPFCDATLAIADRVNDAISRMTLKEKIGMLDNGSPPIAALGVPAYNWWSEASTGVANEIERRGKNTSTTKFAFPITTGMSFNRTLWQLTGRQIGREARAMMNVGTAYSTFWAPVINLAREPRWGRNIETPGEDPYLTGQYAIRFTKGMQEAPEDPYHIQASACCKHFVLNSLEGTTEKDGEEEDRMHVNSNVTQQDLLDSYMLPFQACVEQGKVSGLMCSYNSVNGVPSCANDWLLKDIARGEWGFDGYVTSDCDADALVSTTHHYHNDTSEEAVRDILRAGTDNDCGGFVGNNAMSALNKSFITMGDIDERLAMLWRVRFRLGHFDPLGPLDKITPEATICTDYAIDTSLDGVVQSSALLKNDAKTLPLAAGSAGTVAYATKVVSVPGVPSAADPSTAGIPAAVAMAKAADTVVLVVGTDLKMASEGHDAVNITLTDAQTQLIQQVSDAAKKPITVIYMTAVPLDISSLLKNPKVGAILHVGQPSVTILGAAELLFGKVSPAGRTIQTIYPEAYQDQISIFDFNMRPGPSPFARPDCTDSANPAACPRGTNPGRTYRFYVDTPVVPFGFGLSYSSFAYNVVSAVAGGGGSLLAEGADAVRLDAVRELLDATAHAGRTFPDSNVVSGAAPLVSYLVNVTNTGSVDAADVVLGFLTPPGAGVNGVPLKTLFGFERIFLKAGETKSVYLYPALTDFTQVDASGQRNVFAGEYTFSFGVQETLGHGMGYAEHRITTV